MLDSKMTFTHTDLDGVVTTKEFSPETWVNSLDEFVKFLRGCGYQLGYDSVCVNKTKHPYIHYEDVYNLGIVDL